VFGFGRRPQAAADPASRAGDAPPAPSGPTAGAALPAAARAMADAAEAARLAELAGVLMLDTRTGVPSWTGSHGRRRAGPGETFWQFREHRAEDGTRAIDWRRSARGERLFVRELEHTGAARLRLWLDPSPGFGWSSAPGLAGKRTRGAVILAALGLAAANAGERIDIAGEPVPTARGGAAALLERLHAPSMPEIPPPGRHPAAAHLLASDFYAPVEVWHTRLQPLAAQGIGVLLAVQDPAEEQFPFQGRTLFEDPRGRADPALIGRAEAIRRDYLERFEAHRRAMAEMARSIGWAFVTHRSDQPAGTVVASIAAHIGGERRRERRA